MEGLGGHSLVQGEVTPALGTLILALTRLGASLCWVFGPQTVPQRYGGAFKELLAVPQSRKFRAFLSFLPPNPLTYPTYLFRGEGVYPAISSASTSQSWVLDSNPATIFKALV